MRCLVMAKPDTGAKLRAALFLSLADVFIGASGLILALIVLASESDARRVERVPDLILTCGGTAQGGWTLTAEDGAPETVDTVLDRLTTQNAFLLRVGVLTTPETLWCFDEVADEVRDRNRALSNRGEIGTVLAVTWLPQREEDGHAERP